MENVNFLENLANRLGQNATVKNVFGDPVTTGGKTVIPVARVAFGFGGGYGEGKKKKSLATSSEPKDNEKQPGEGAGGGGGMYARPKGVYEITEKQTRFIPVNNNKQLLMAFAAGFLIRRWLKKRRK